MTAETATGTLDSLHHVAIVVSDIGLAVRWYRETFRCEIAYQDATWAMLRFENCNLALVSPGQHPPHLGFVTPTEVAEIANQAQVKLLVYYHLLPAPDNALIRSLFTKGVGEVRRGAWDVADDGSLYTLPIGTDEIRFGSVAD